MKPDPKTHCFFCRNDMRRFTKDRVHSCYDVVEALEQRISDLEKEIESLRRSNIFLEGRLK